jgi:hypothetical protein
MLSVVHAVTYAKCLYAECRHAQCRYAHYLPLFNVLKNKIRSPKQLN